jgi:hypothetical protein
MSDNTGIIKHGLPSRRLQLKKKAIVLPASFPRSRFYISDYVNLPEPECPSPRFFCSALRYPLKNKKRLKKKSSTAEKLLHFTIWCIMLR